MTFRQLAGERPICPVSRRRRFMALLRFFRVRLRAKLNSKPARSRPCRRETSVSPNPQLGWVHSSRSRSLPVEERSLGSFRGQNALPFPTGRELVGPRKLREEAGARVMSCGRNARQPSPRLCFASPRARPPLVFARPTAHAVRARRLVRAAGPSPSEGGDIGRGLSGGTVSRSARSGGRRHRAVVATIGTAFVHTAPSRRQPWHGQRSLTCGLTFLFPPMATCPSG